MVKTAAEGKLTKAILEHFGWEVKHRVLSDSSAARSIAQRVGCGKVKHLSLKQMWLQEAVREKELEIGKVDTLLNLADLGTKALEPSRMDSLMKQLPLVMATLLIGSVAMAQAHQAAMESRLDQLTSWYLFVVRFFALVGLVWFTVKSSGLVLKGCGRLFGIGMGEGPESCSSSSSPDAMESPRSPVADLDPTSGQTGEDSAVSSATVGPKLDTMRLRAGEGINDYPRVLRDTLMLLTVEGLKSGLREESLSVTGLKTVLVERLVRHFQDDIIGKDGVRLRRPSGKQLRYTLWINSRVRNCSIQYEDVKTSAGAAERKPE